ncbi:MAG: 3-phosphoshikimate 1-carboxyvinyltransferase [Acidimicrobiia bacterium]|nr:3-phosphoshikimate 1-carboxyvinyltransferase [Acidimicrobiia bacterium]
MTERESVVVEGPGQPFAAGIQVPGDKSLSHRAIILSAMAKGTSVIRQAATGQDVLSSISVVESLGVEVDGDRFVSPGIDAWTTPSQPLDCGNSGTTMRLMAGALSGSSLTATLVGDESLSRRPMRRLVEPLESLGASVTLSDDDTAPMTVGGAGETTAADIEIAVASAQVRTAFAFGAVRAEGESTITSPPGYRNHTERWLETMGLGRRESSTTFRILPGDIPPFQYDIPGDPSSAAFLWAAAAIIEGAHVITPNVSLNPGRIGFLEILEAMGASVTGEVTGAVLGDPVGTVGVQGNGLRGIAVGGALAAAALDELPLLAVVASYAEGTTVLSDAKELKAKESDRITSTVAMINSLGGGAQPREDGFEVLGLGWLDGGVVEADGDHRIAMAGAVAATGATGPVTISGAETVAVSWPRFFEALEALWSSQ